MAPTPTARAKKMLKIILVDDFDLMELIDQYMHGIQAEPYMPDFVSDEYKLIAQRSIDNWMPLLVRSPSQACYVDNFRPGRELPEGQSTLDTPEWRHWQDSRLDSRQVAIYEGAFTFGHSFTLTEKVGPKGKVITKGLSARRTAALFADPANDETPLWSLTITSNPGGTPENPVPGTARMWDSTYEYAVTFTEDLDDKGVRVKRLRAHGASENPVTRFAAVVDLEGRTIGVVEPMIALQDRINQTVFDLLMAQTYESIQVRTVTGMAPPMKKKVVNAGTPDEEWVYDLDVNGQPQPIPIKGGAGRFLFAESTDAKFGTLPGTPLNGFIESWEAAIRDLSARSQTPPAHLLGQIANLSADALTAAEISFLRKVAEFRVRFGESWERVFRLAAELSGETTAVDDYSGETIWRDMEGRSLAQSADGLGKLAEQLQIPRRALWERVPNVTSTEIKRWNELYEQDQTERRMADAMERASGGIQRPAAARSAASRAAGGATGTDTRVAA